MFDEGSASEGVRMDESKQGARPDDRDPPPEGRRSKTQESADAGTNSTGTGEATASHPPAEAAAAERADAEEEILEREPDGRYRIVGRRPRERQ
jgi:hypothetical protein